MSPPSPRTLIAMPADLRSRLQADLTRQRATRRIRAYERDLRDLMLP